jgi:hypothetical protein
MPMVVFWPARVDQRPDVRTLELSMKYLFLLRHASVAQTFMPGYDYIDVNIISSFARPGLVAREGWWWIMNCRCARTVRRGAEPFTSFSMNSVGSRTDGAPRGELL